VKTPLYEFGRGTFPNSLRIEGVAQNHICPSGVGQLLVVGRAASESTMAASLFEAVHNLDTSKELLK